MVDNIYVLVIYDITDNKRRVKFAKNMLGYGIRVQKSAFEAWISPSMYHKMIKEIPKMIKAAEDSVRVYRLKGDTKLALYGKNPVLERSDFHVI